MTVIKVKHNQSLFDISLQEYGDVRGVYWLVEDNNLDGLVDTVLEGASLKIRDIKINVQMVDHLKNHTIATLEGAKGEGLGFWRIGEDFVIS